MSFHPEAGTSTGSYASPARFAPTITSFPLAKYFTVGKWLMWKAAYASSRLACPTQKST